METLHVDRGYSEVNNRVVGLVWPGATLIDRYLHFRRYAAKLCRLRDRFARNFGN